MKPIVLLGHAHVCPLHGPGAVVSGSFDTLVNGKPVARVGDMTSCGASIVTGSAATLIDGSPVARRGDMTTHGGVLTEGDYGWLIE